MRLAVFSDMHANEVALATCINYANHVGVDGYVFLGDHVTDCPYPRRTLDLMRDAARRLPTWMLRGNREDYLLKHQADPQDGWKVSSSTGSLLYTYQNLEEEDLEFLRRMPIAQVVELPGCPPLRIAHATPQSNNVLLFPGTEALENVLRACRSRRCCPDTATSSSATSRGASSSSTPALWGCPPTASQGPVRPGQLPGRQVERPADERGLRQGSGNPPVRGKRPHRYGPHVGAVYHQDHPGRGALGHRMPPTGPQAGPRRP